MEAEAPNSKTQALAVVANAVIEGDSPAALSLRHLVLMIGEQAKTRTPFGLAVIEAVKALHNTSDAVWSDVGFSEKMQARGLLSTLMVALDIE